MEHQPARRASGAWVISGYRPELCALSKAPAPASLVLLCRQAPPPAHAFPSDQRLSCPAITSGAAWRDGERVLLRITRRGGRGGEGGQAGPRPAPHSPGSAAEGGCSAGGQCQRLRRGEPGGSPGLTGGRRRPRRRGGEAGEENQGAGAADNARVARRPARCGRGGGRR